MQGDTYNAENTLVLEASAKGKQIAHSVQDGDESDTFLEEILFEIEESRHHMEFSEPDCPNTKPYEKAPDVTLKNSVLTEGQT